MDTFKLLARSTSIQKSSPALQKAPNNQLPSAGLSNDYQSIPDTSLPSPKSKSQGTKRKRNEGPKEQSHGAHEVNGYRSKNVQSGIQPTDVRRDNALGRNPPHPSAGNDTPRIAVLSLEECRRTLKKHKLKVTVLRDPQKHNDRNQGGQDRREDKSQSNAPKQLFPQPLTSFDLLRSKYGVSKRLLENMNGQGYAEPTEVQIGSIPLLVGANDDLGLETTPTKKSGEHSKMDIDLLTIAPTGSGKTLCFVTGLLHQLLRDRQRRKKSSCDVDHAPQVQALVVAPTHELVDQIVNESKKLTRGTGIKVSALGKGAKIQSHASETTDEKDEKLNMTAPLVKSDILVSTPLMLLHVISGTDSTPQALPNVRFLILDEADVLLDPLFRDQTLGIWEACTHKSLHTSLWSATIGSSIETLAQTFILDRRRKLNLKPTHHHIIRLVVGLKDTAIPHVSHRLVYAASEQGKLLALRQLLHPSATPSNDTPSLRPPFLIFTQTIPRAIALHSELLYDIALEAGGSARMAVLHSNLSDTARSNVMAGFRKGEIWILITTDLLSRGVDFRGMNGVVNYDIPNTGASYVHRVGRTGRQGREGGVAVTLYTKEDVPYVKNIANVIAASDRQKTGDASDGSQAKGVQKWLLDALPKVGKNTKKDLKRRGVESRRVTKGEGDGKMARKMRISTKSGYDRRLENKRKGISERKRRQEGRHSLENDFLEDEEWGGIDS